MAGRYSVKQHTTNAAPPADHADYSEAREKFVQLGEKEVAEYLRLKEQKARYEKAEEILAKMLLIMLHDLGIRASGQQIAQLKSAPASTEQATEAKVEKSSTSLTANTHPRATSATPTPTPADTPTFDPAKAKEISNEADVKDFLQKAALEDFLSSLKGGAPLNQEQIEMLNGTYAGEVIFSDPARAPWQVHMVFNGRMTEKGPRGRHEIILMRNGRRFSRTRGRIDDKHYVGMNGDAHGVVVDVNDGNAYFQLFYFPRLNTFNGNVYVKESIGVYKLAGIVNLIRR